MRNTTKQKIDEAIRTVLAEDGMIPAPGCRTTVEPLYGRPGVAVTANYAAVPVKHEHTKEANSAAA